MLAWYSESNITRKKYGMIRPFPKKISCSNEHKRKAFEKIVGKGENAGNQHFLLSQQCFLHYQDRSYKIRDLYFVVSKCMNLVQSKIMSFGKELL